MNFDQIVRRNGSPFQSLVAYFNGSAVDTALQKQKLEIGMRYVEHVLEMYSELEVDQALPKVIDALFAYTAIDSTLRSALTGHVASDPTYSISYELAHLVRERIRSSLLTHLSWRRDMKGESVLAGLDLEEVVAQFTRTVRDVFSRSLREGAAILSDSDTREDVARQCLSVLSRSVRSRF